MFATRYLNQSSQVLFRCVSGGIRVSNLASTLTTIQQQQQQQQQQNERQIHHCDRNNNKWSSCCVRRTFSDTIDKNKLVNLKIDKEMGIAEISMHNGAVNSLSLEMCQALVSSIKEAEGHGNIHGMVLQSNSATTFSAGLDILEMHEPKIDRLRKFWSSFQELYLTLYGSRLFCVAAIEGHAPAAGCMLALSCDYRIMTATDVPSKLQPLIGLNETKLGIVAPPWLAQQMIDCVGVRHAELALSLGTLYTPEQALKIHLVDEVLPLTEVYKEARNKAHVVGTKIPPHARFASKLLIRQPHLDKLKATAELDIDHFVNFVTNPKVQKSIAGYLEMLGNKKKS